MAEQDSNVDLVVIGAGAAGLAAARTARAAGLNVTLLEASHRIGGRAYTEELAPGVAFDLGCHWMHSASLNPFVAIADQHGFHYEREDAFEPRVFRAGRWANEAEQAELKDFTERNAAAIARASRKENDAAVIEVTERDSPWTAMFDYWISLWTSRDAGRVSAVDTASYRETDEDWPLKEGYGALVARHFAGEPVSLNAKVKRIEWGAKDVRVHSVKGRVTARAAIVTVSTNILASGVIAFDPPLPDWKQAAIHALPLGNHNRICLLYDRDVFGPDAPASIAVMEPDSEPLVLEIRPFGYDYVVGLTGGGFADRLERAGVEASVDLVKEKLKSVFGGEVTKHILRHDVTAWGGDPWVKGAYSAAAPGQAPSRAELARALDGKLFFAGEATSAEFMATCHGAYLTGIEAAKDAARLMR
ncbi:MAG: NAD(P)/FAD-dependent oxidoreductase [Alphaproteobacteria bacterium]